MIKFIRIADAALVSGDGRIRSLADPLCETMEKCREERYYDSPEAFIASWLVLELLESKILIPLNGNFFKAALTANAILRGNPAVDAFAELFWADGYQTSVENWTKPGTNPLFGQMSDRECFLFGFSKNAERVLPIVKKITTLKLKWKPFEKLARTLATIEKVLRVGDAAPQDNDLLHDNIPSVHEGLETLLLRWPKTFQAMRLHEIEKKAGISHLLRWNGANWRATNGAFREDWQLRAIVQALGAIVMVEKQQAFEFFGPLIVSLRQWEPTVVGGFIGEMYTRVLSGSPANYERLLRWWPRKMERIPHEGDKSRRYTQMRIAQRRALRNWYDSDEGTAIRLAIKELFNSLKSCARQLGKVENFHNEVKYDLRLSSDEICSLPKPLRRRYETAEKRLGKRAEYILKIIELKRPWLAAHAIWLFENDFIDRAWNADEISTYVRYTYRK